jgi:uncharacterized protein YycO
MIGGMSIVESAHAIVSSYAAEARSQFREGDVLCFRGRGFVSWCIRMLTRSDYSHAGMVFLYEGRVYCLEAVGDGVRLMLMSQLMRRYEGGIDYFEVDAGAPARKHALSFGFRQLGKLYDTAGIVRFLWMLITRSADAARRDEHWFCSELVAAAYREAKEPLVEMPESYTSPSDLAQSQRLTLRYALKP